MPRMRVFPTCVLHLPAIALGAVAAMSPTGLGFITSRITVLEQLSVFESKEHPGIRLLVPTPGRSRAALSGSSHSDVRKGTSCSPLPHDHLTR
ncbi:hypothetical protein FND50_21375 [Rhodococcus sp. WB9]|uniref:hypothetical protein n=1 Tax=Rhodococcus sp. WB9 TaxID=2594007 RepID=UPI001185BE1C|nr:hypothetical protein [Rhodococcus sp. WB9]QDQ93052.1 hypothetical protein FND50_21375 [Rhodococcus sp. WB9]